ncbi:hypothetical protein AB0K14_03125 [Actinosynnema sp. NPDC050801]|uniref:hypothetical protein n=1 Tax=unclassified Actinosynnema TaxID=2637065 RepID=UPI0033CE0EEA
MNEHPVIARLRAAGFLVAPNFDGNGFDSGLLFVQQRQGHMAVVCAYSDDYALGARLPLLRDWSRPFESTLAHPAAVAPFADVVDELLRPARSAGTSGEVDVNRAGVEGGAR